MRIQTKGFFAGFYKRFKWGAFGLLAHSFQAGQYWVFLIRIGRKRFGYRTRGDATRYLEVWHDSGFHFPWQKRTVSGRG